MGNLLQELKRRNVYKIATGYVVSSWLLLQVAATLIPAFELPESTIRIPALVLLAGFPIVIALSWVFDFTADGIKKTGAADPNETVVLLKKDYLLSAALVLMIGVVVAQQIVILGRSPDSEPIVLDDGMSIAVLPFDNLSPDPNNAYFAAGVHEEILNLLQKIPDVRVISRPAVLRYQDTTLSPTDIAAELNIRYLMSGSIRFADNQVRINLQLTQASDNTTLWSEPYLRELDDIFAIQSDVALQVASAMEATLSPNEIARITLPTSESTEAYTIFLQHRFRQESVNANGDGALENDGWITQGIRDLKRAIELDPRFAMGLAELAFLTYYTVNVTPAEEWYELDRDALYDQAASYATQAIEIDQNMARAYSVRSRVAFERRQWEAFERDGLRSVGPTDIDGRGAFAFAYNLGFIGKYDESYRWWEDAISKQPSQAFYRETQTATKIEGGDYNGALITADQFRAVGGDENAYHIFRAFAFHHLGMHSESLSELSLLTSEPLNVVNLGAVRGFRDYLICRSQDYEQVLNEMDPFNVPYAMCALGAGDFDHMFDAYRTAMMVGTPLNNMRSKFVPNELKADPRWQVLEDYMDLPN